MGDCVGAVLACRATRCFTMTGRESADTSGYLPSYIAFAFSAGATKSRRRTPRRASTTIASIAPAAQRPLAHGVPVAVVSCPTSAQRRSPRRPAPRSSSARPPRCRDLRCTPAPLASPPVSPQSSAQSSVSRPRARPSSAAGSTASAPPACLRGDARSACRRRPPCRARRSSPLRSSAEPTTWAEPGGVRSTTRLRRVRDLDHPVADSTRRRWSSGASRSGSAARGWRRPSRRPAPAP